MKRMAWIAAGAALLLAVSGAAAQSLGDVARSARKAKAQQSTATRHFDNDNLPAQDHVSVVGPETANSANQDGNQASDQGKQGQPGQEASTASSTPAEAKAPDQGNQGQPGQEASNPSSTPAEAKAPASEAKAPAAENKAGEWNKKIQEQKAKVDTLSKDLDLSQREYRLRAVAMYSDAGNRLRNAVQWDKEDAQYKKEIADKQQALDQAKQDLNDMEDQARK